MPALVDAVEELLRDPRVRAKWRDDDVWTVALSLIGVASTRPEIDLELAAKRIVAPTPVRQFGALANMTWESNPSTIGTVTLATMGSDGDAERLSSHLGLSGAASQALSSHAEQLTREFGPYVVASVVSARQERLAHDDFLRSFDDLIGLTLLFSSELERHGIVSGRGATNRPGIRGLALDRDALGKLLSEKGAGELGARVLSIGDWGARNSFHWYSANSMPLDSLLDSRGRALVGDLLEGTDAIAQRLRVAARWYARAFWADADEDAALAVSVALDSLLTGKEAVPGAVSKGRFALLEREPARRAERFERYDEVYRVRSAIAHGGDASRRLQSIGGSRSMLADARWVARRLLELRTVAAPETDSDLRDAWNGLQWGTSSWTNRPGMD
ncbi:hypothetical protein ASF40_20000 [Microbacterium sp. Leaf288]|uniref:HEPN domain-containing protein n=1 Tax=Microbacterium sp. Leaf288 TaxID=1736323 RepID=UPI000726EB5D|nr:HEPN domain-containing protein [Microbacterium sp. Leaf288]KQP67816.1 hypothetical protein ASF40_20000 [Microbacterium sp. Leaf288]